MSDMKTFLEESPFVILRDCMIFLSLLLYVTRMFISTVSYLAQLAVSYAE